MWLGMLDLFLSKYEALPENSQKYQMRVEHFQKLGFLHQLGARTREVWELTINAILFVSW